MLMHVSHTFIHTHRSTHVGFLLLAKCIGVYICTCKHICMHANMQPGHKYAHRLQHIYAHRYYTHTHIQWVQVCTEACAYVCSHPHVHMHIHRSITSVCSHTRRWGKDAEEQVDTLVATAIVYVCTVKSFESQNFTWAA